MKTIINLSDVGIKCLEIRNAGGKVWLIPFSDVRKGLELYQPSSKKGLALKKYLPAIKHFPFVINKFGVHIVYVQISSDFKFCIKDLFDQPDVCYSIFLGTPGKDKKTTIQLFTSKEILAYCKCSENPRICDSFRAEAEHLTELHRRGVRGIPKVLMLKNIDEKHTIYIQSTVKPFDASVPHKITQQHIDFLMDLSEKTRQKRCFSETDYYSTLCGFKKNYRKFPFDYEIDTIENLIHNIENEMQEVKEYSFYHGDFTPWNTYLSKNNSLEVFDFEYSKLTYPDFLDIFHFFTQTKLYESKKNEEKIWNDFIELFVHGKLSTLFDNVFFSYLLYLIDVINFYLERDYGAFSEETFELLRIRYKLLLRCYSAYLEEM